MSEPTRQPQSKPKSIMRSLGEFVGHIAHAVKTDPAAGRQPSAPAPADSGGTEPPQATRRTVSSTTHEEPPVVGPDGQSVILRRTTIEEIEVRPPQAPSDP